MTDSESPALDDFRSVTGPILGKDASEPPKGKKRTGTFITGLVLVLPLLITFLVLRLALRWVNESVTPYFIKFLMFTGFPFLEQSWVDWVAPAVSIALLVTFIYIAGAVGSNVLGKQFINLIEKLLLNVPVVRGIYSTTRQFLDTFSSSGRAFQKVVLVEYPRKGLWTMALLTSDNLGEVQQKSTEKSLVAVFVPTTPNPTSGWLLFVPSEDVVELDMSVDDAFKMIISGGVLTPTYLPAKN